MQAVAAGDDVLRPVMVDGTCRQVGDLHAWRVDLGLPLRIGEAHDRVGIGDVEVVADERHAERRIEVFEENGSRFRNAIAVGVAQKRNAVRARDAGAGPLLRHVKEEAFDPFGVLRPRPDRWFRRRGRRHWAARRASGGDRARWRRALTARSDAGVGWVPVGPTLGGGDVHGGNERGIGRRYRGIRTDAGLIGQFGGITAGAEEE